MPTKYVLSARARAAASVLYCQRLRLRFEQTPGPRATILSELAGKNEDEGHDVAVDDGVLFSF